jgi:hypothetical protein
MGSAGIESMAFGAESTNRDVTEPSTMGGDSGARKTREKTCRPSSESVEWQYEICTIKPVE